MGPSGCGKTTTLRLIAGFLEPDSGDVVFEGKVINDLPAYKRQVNTIFQRYALFPHLNVYENIAFGLRIKKFKEKEIKEKVEEMLKLVNLSGLEKRDIDTLSGGQQQRVAIARAIANCPRVLLLDEPLAALDLKLRKDMQKELKNIQQQLGITFIFVTHDQEEALTMSDRVVVMDHPLAGGEIHFPLVASCGNRCHQKVTAEKILIVDAIGFSIVCVVKHKSAHRGNALVLVTIKRLFQHRHKTFAHRKPVFDLIFTIKGKPRCFFAVPCVDQALHRKDV